MASATFTMPRPVALHSPENVTQGKCKQPGSPMDGDKTRFPAEGEVVVDKFGNNAKA